MVYVRTMKPNYRFHAAVHSPLVDSDLKGISVHSGMKWEQFTRGEFASNCQHQTSCSRTPTDLLPDCPVWLMVLVHSRVASLECPTECAYLRQHWGSCLSCR